MFSARATVTTMLSSFGGGSAGLAICYTFYGGKIKVSYVASCVFSSLVASTGKMQYLRLHTCKSDMLSFGILTPKHCLFVSHDKYSSSN